MAGCLNHLENGKCDPNCPEKDFCHDYSGWRLNGKPVIYHTYAKVPSLVSGGINDPNVDFAITIGGDETCGKYAKIIPIETLRRAGV